MVDFPAALGSSTLTNRLRLEPERNWMVESRTA
jgi:hypothetical protein